MPKKVDANHGEIVKALRQVGCSVQSLAAVGHGVPDLLVGRMAKDGRTENILLEIKRPVRQAKLTRDQVDWHLAWRGQVAIVRSVEDALQIIGVKA